MNIANEQTLVQRRRRGPELTVRQLEHKRILEPRQISFAGDDRHHLVTQSIR